MRKATKKSQFEMQEEAQTIQAWNPEAQTILSTMEHLTPSGNGDDFFDPCLIINDPKAYAYLEERLNMSHEEVMVLTVGVYITSSRGHFDLGDIGHMMNLHPIQRCQVSKDIESLYDKGYLLPHPNRGGDEQWMVTKAAMSALQDNRPFDVTELKLQSNMEFLEQVGAIIDDGMHFDTDNGIKNGIRHLMHINEHLPIVRNLKRYAPDVDSFKVLLAIMATIAVDGYAFGDMNDFTNVVSARTARAIMRALNQHTHPYVQQGILEPYGEDGLAQSEQWCLSRKGWHTLLENEQEVAQITTPKEQATPLTSYKLLTKKELFFSGKTAEQAQRLRDLLSDEQYHRICESLRKRDMQPGFACLFYGTPGTGKTELVQQLAIETERDIYQVNIASLRDKYVGESEKRVQAVFDTYRSLVQRCEKTPILFFNEADAIFGKRLENTERSADKMENAMQNIILQEMEKMEGIMICTTNLTSNLDSAFERRFLFKVEFERPSNEARKKIWQSKLKGLTDEQASTLAARYDFSGGQIENITRKQIINAVLTDNDQLDFEQIMRDCGEEKLQRDNGKKIGF